MLPLKQHEEVLEGKRKESGGERFLQFHKIIYFVSYVFGNEDLKFNNDKHC